MVFAFSSCAGHADKGEGREPCLPSGAVCGWLPKGVLEGGGLGVVEAEESLFSLRKVVDVCAVGPLCMFATFLRKRSNTS